jgi:hypothetical protein
MPLHQLARNAAGQSIESVATVENTTFRPNAIHAHGSWYDPSYCFLR